jgi:hypothetical protein
MSNNERANQWQNHINQWQESGLSGVKFCKQSELDLAQFHYWKNKHCAQQVKVPKAPKRSVGFASVVVSDSPQAVEGIRFTLPNGCAIEGISKNNVSLIGAILAQL